MVLEGLNIFKVSMFAIQVGRLLPMTNMETCRKVSPAWSRPVRLEGDPFLKIVAETQTGSLSSTLMLLEFPPGKEVDSSTNTCQEERSMGCRSQHQTLTGLCQSSRKALGGGGLRQMQPPPPQGSWRLVLRKEHLTV